MDGSHLGPTAGPVLDGISSLQLHLLTNRHAGAVVGRHIVGADGLDERLVNPAHLPASQVLRVIGR